MRTSLIGILAFIFLLTSAMTLKNDNLETLFDFSKTSKIDSWIVVNDDVMGGVSNASFEINDDGHARFEGKVSTANNGGFASVRYRFKKKDVTGKSTVSIRLKGDLKNYQFRLKSNSGSYYSYITTFSTSNNWETVKINLNDLFPSFRGRKLDMPNFSENSIEEISFLIANNKNESFKLLIDSIKID